jgi:hypothetical protein
MGKYVRALFVNWNRIIDFLKSWIQLLFTFCNALIEWTEWMKNSHLFCVTMACSLPSPMLHIMKFWNINF